MKIKNQFLFIVNVFYFISAFFLFFFFFKKNIFYVNNYSKKKQNKKIYYNFFFHGYIFFLNLFKSIFYSKKNIFFQFYILKNDFLGKKFLKLLNYKSYKCLIFLILDKIGSINFISYIKNIFFINYNNNKLLINIRNHKKIVFIDNNILWIGGNNIGIEYLSLNPYIGIWNDFHCKIINIIPNYIINFFYFNNKNNFIINKIELSKKFFFFNNNINFLNILNFIKKKIIIMSPYIILDLYLLNIIKHLIFKKKKIFLYISYKTDNLYIQGVSIIFLKLLINYKIKIYFLNIGFFHRKIYIFDDFYILFGSNNFDIRSIYINKECLFVFSDIKIKKIFFKNLKNNLLNFLLYKKKFFFIKFFYIISFLNYFFQ